MRQMIRCEAVRFWPHKKLPSYKVVDKSGSLGLSFEAKGR
jgi:hypothetical protein